MKQPWKSKTLWTNFMLAALALFWPGFAEYIKERPETAAILIPLINIGLRFMTKSGIKVKRYERLLPLLLLLTGCSTVYQDLKTDIFYKRDLEATINGVYHKGISTLPLADNYDFVFEAPGEIEYMIIRTCHREEVYRPEDKKLLGFIKIGKKEVAYLYEPTQKERDELCPLRVDVFDSDTGQHSWMFNDFETPELTLGVDMVCNGKRFFKTSVAACQVRHGLVQVLRFMEPIRFAPPMPDICSVPLNLGDNEYEINVAPEECVYYAENQKGDRMRITFVGYSGLLVRGGIK